MPYDREQRRTGSGADGARAAGERIKVVCHGCGARYQVRASKVQGHRFRATCKRCGGIIVAHCSNAFTVLPESGGGAGRGTPALHLDGGDLYQEEEAAWYLVIGGKPHGPLGASQVSEAFATGRISARTYVWRAGDPEWRRLAEVPEFMEAVAEGQHTSFYQGQEMGREPTGETRAAGPMGIRRQAPSQLDEATAERTGYYQGEEGSSEEPTRFHVRDEQLGHQPEPPLPERPSWAAPGESWPALPLVPPRPAILPAPTGATRTPGRQSLPGVPGSGPAPGPTAGPTPEHTRPLSERERADAIHDVQLLPSLAPMVPPAPAADLPPPKSVFAESLKPLGPPAGPALLTPAEEPFWTAGKIAAAAAIGGGLAVAMAVVVVVALVRPKPRPVVEVAPVAAQKTPAPAPAPAPTPEPAPEPEAAPAPAPAPKPPPPTEEVPIKVTPPAAERAVKPVAKAKAKPKAKAKSRRKPKRRRAKAKGIGGEVDALLAGAAKGGKADGVDADALLAAGSGSKPRPAASKPDPDALLAAGSGSKPKPKPASKRPSQAQIRSAMAKVRRRVQGCYNRYQVPGLAKVRVVLQPSGKSEVTVLGKFAGTPTGFCVQGAVQAARFPAFSGDAVTFTYPFQLE